MAETEAKKQRRQPTKLTIKSRPVNEAHPRQWGETVKVPKAKLDALVEEYKRLHDENWKYDIAAKRTAKSNMSRKIVVTSCETGSTRASRGCSGRSLAGRIAPCRS